ncbi:MAG: hypothetical protein Q9207_002652 [Kuettlingeria erythrocarpa]
MSLKQALTFRFVRASQVKWLNYRIEKAAHFVKDENMLESAISAPENNQHYAGVQDPAMLAAILSTRLIKNHPFANGNKRTALLAANAFLAQTGKVLQQNSFDPENNDVITQAHTDVAMGTLDEEALASIYRNAWQNVSSKQCHAE